MSLPGMGTSSVPVRQVMLVPWARRRGRPPFPEEVAASAGARSAKISVPSVSRITLFVGAPASSYVTALHRKPLFVTELSSKPASTLSSPPGRLPAASWVLHHALRGRARVVVRHRAPQEAALRHRALLEAPSTLS